MKLLGKYHTPWIIRTQPISKVVELLLVEIVPYIFKVLVGPFDHLDVGVPPLNVKHVLFPAPQWDMEHYQGMPVSAPISMMFLSTIPTYSYLAGKLVEEIYTNISGYCQIPPSWLATLNLTGLQFETK